MTELQIRTPSTPTFTSVFSLPLSSFLHESTSSNSSRSSQTINTSIDIANIEISIQDQIQDTDEQTFSCHIRCHSCAHSQVQRNFADRDPFFSVHPFNDHTTTTFSVIFTTSVPETFDSFPLFSIASFINRNFLFPTGPQHWPSGPLPYCVHGRCGLHRTRSKLWVSLDFGPTIGARASEYHRSSFGICLPL